METQPVSHPDLSSPPEPSPQIILHLEGGIESTPFSNKHISDNLKKPLF